MVVLLPISRNARGRNVVPAGGASHLRHAASINLSDRPAILWRFDDGSATLSTHPGKEGQAEVSD
jgi:hypothetical protein